MTIRMNGFVHQHRNIDAYASTEDAVPVREGCQQSLEVELRELSRCEDILSDWLRLCDKAKDPNPYYCPSFLYASAEHLVRGLQCHVVLVWEGKFPRTLVGLFPVAIKGMRHGYIQPVCELWNDCVTGISVPLISGENVDAVWSSFLKFISKHPKFPDIVHCPQICPHSHTGQALQSLGHCQELINVVDQTHERAIARPVASYSAYAKRWSKKRQVNIRTAKRKLTDRGTLSLETVYPGEKTFSDDLDELLRLEASGWKGKRRTAFNSRPESRKFALNAFNPDGLPSAAQLTVLRFNGQIIAGLFNLTSQGHVFGVRSGFDESYSAFSPGILAYVGLLEHLLEKDGHCELDSCTDGSHLLNKYWLERKTIEGVYLTAEVESGGRRIERVLTLRNAVKRGRDHCEVLLNRMRQKG